VKVAKGNLFETAQAPLSTQGLPEPVFKSGLSF